MADARPASGVTPCPICGAPLRGVEGEGVVTVSSSPTRAAEALTYISGYYGVPAALGQRVIADGQLGTIVWAQDARLVVLIDGAEHPTYWHPTWRMEYVNA